ncbi:hypothetical protein E2C01_088894 [Portunus trituberculatus]|uniref:Zinc finger PHD-type domain-containing protein n=1 Tax=Portunus trituberculatus TaxID=210409 RepID=A0A5B7JHA9_PORTR|nr:hypothetical protein [Portunus trituberculatus]
MPPKISSAPRGAYSSKQISTPSSSGAISKRRKLVGGQPGGNPAHHGTPPHNPSTPVSTPALPLSTGASSGSSLCGSCELQVGDGSIGCDKCHTWFHPSSLCLGLSDRVIDAIREGDGEGIEFVCTQCRARSTNVGGGSCDGVISQLSVMVKSLCAVVAKLTERVDQLFTRSTFPPPPSASVSVPSADDLCISTIREEIVEMEERRKRRDSLIFRVVAATNDFALTKIKDIVNSLLDTTSTLTNIHCINRDRGLYRVTLSDDDLCKQLSVCKDLRNNPFHHGVYINRDLTYKQRKDLYERPQCLCSANVSDQQSNAYTLS